MARGRLISRTLGSSRKFAALRHHAGKLGEFAQLLYPLLIACSDDFGRMAGDAFTVKLAVFPSSPRPETDFTAALEAMHRARLIELYEHEGDPLLAVVEFAEHQTGLHKRTKSRFPEPPGTFREIPGNSRKFPEVPEQEKRTEEKRREGIQSPNLGTAQEEDRRKAENVGVSTFIARFCECYAKHRHGAIYLIRREKHVPLIRRLLKTYGNERLLKLALMLLKTDDDWVHHTDRGIEILSVKASWLDNRLAEYEAAHGPIQVAS